MASVVLNPAGGNANKTPNLQHFETALRLPDTSMLRTVLYNMPNVDIPLSNGGWTGLMVACNAGDLDKVELLLNAGADACFVSSPDMETPFTVASMMTRKGDEECVACMQLLLKNVPAERQHVIVNAKNRINTTALMHAARTGKPNTIRKLISLGANVDDVDSKGCSALRIAVSVRNIPCCRALMEAGSDASKKAKDGLSPLNRAESLGMPQLIAILTARQDSRISPPPLGRSNSIGGNGSLSNVPARVDSGLHGSRSSLHESVRTSPGSKADFAKSTENGSKTSLSSGRFDSALNGSTCSLNESTKSTSPKSGIPTLPVIKSMRASKTNENSTPPIRDPHQFVKAVSISDVLRPQQNLPGNVEKSQSFTPLHRANSLTGPPGPVVKVLDVIPEKEKQSQVKSSIERISPLSLGEIKIEKKIEEEKDQVDQVKMNPEPPSSLSLQKLEDWGDEPVVLKKPADKNEPVSAEMKEEEEKKCALASSSVVQMDELEMFLSSVNLTSLMPIFRQNNIKMEELLCLDEEDLKKLGVESMGARKKVLEGAHLFTVTPFGKDSLPSVYDRQLTCKDCIHVFSNVASQLGCMVGSTVYARRQICRLPQLLLSTEVSPNQNIDALILYIEEAEHCAVKISEELKHLKQNVKQIQTRTEILPRYVDSERDKKMFVRQSSKAKWYFFGVLLVGGSAVVYLNPDLISKLVKKLFCLEKISEILRV